MKESDLIQNYMKTGVDLARYVWIVTPVYTIIEPLRGFFRGTGIGDND